MWGAIIWFLLIGLSGLLERNWPVALYGLSAALVNVAVVWGVGK
jgi:hypothetical protein